VPRRGERISAIKRKEPVVGFVLLKDWPAFGRVDERLIARRFKTRVWKVKERPRYVLDALGIFFLTAFTDLTVTR